MTWLTRLLSPFRAPAPHPEPYTLEEVDGPAWRPTEEEFARTSANLKLALAERTARDQAEIQRFVDGQDDGQAAAERLLRRLPESLQRELAAEAARCRP